MTLQELINRDFNGNISAFAKAYDTTRATTYRLLKGIGKPQEKLRNRLLRKGVHFGDENQSQMKTFEELKQEKFSGTRFVPSVGFQYYDDFNGDFDFTETFAAEQAAIDFLKKWDIDNYFNWPTDEKITLFISKAKFENGEIMESAPFGKFSKIFTIHSTMTAKF